MVEVVAHNKEQSREPMDESKENLQINQKSVWEHGQQLHLCSEDNVIAQAQRIDRKGVKKSSME